MNLDIVVLTCGCGFFLIIMGDLWYKVWTFGTSKLSVWIVSLWLECLCRGTFHNSSDAFRYPWRTHSLSFVARIFYLFGAILQSSSHSFLREIRDSLCNLGSIDTFFEVVTYLIATIHRLLWMTICGHLLIIP